MGSLKLALLLFCVPIALTAGDTVVQTENGPIRGTTVASGKVEAYLGIPFAEPPTGNLRLAKPVPKAPWNYVHDATQLPPSCLQIDLKIKLLTPERARMSEDCLYLNVWVPKAEGGQPKAVMFFIHGGGFLTGSSSLSVYNGERLAEHGDVIVVTINYRLGTLGFFSGSTQDAPGNQGLHDQILALTWVKKNARHFNGDPDNIVIFGESAGAFSVSLLQLSPVSKNLFKRAILQSGSAVNPEYTTENKLHLEINDLYSQYLGCPSKDYDPEDVIKCLRKLPADTFIEAEQALFKKKHILQPRIGDELFPDDSIRMFQKGHFKDSEVLMGVTKDEGSLFISYFNSGNLDLFNRGGDITFNQSTAYQVIKEATLLKNVAADVADEIIQKYLDDVNDETHYTYVKAVSDAIGDSLITCGNVYQAEYQSTTENPVYFYMFNHRTSSSLFPKWMGVPHFEEIPYIFGKPLIGDFTEEEKELSRDVMDMWVSFAKTGNPNIPGGLQWPPYTRKDPKYYVIGERDRVDVRPDNYRCDRWRGIFRSPAE